MKKNYLSLSFLLFFILVIINAQEVGINTKTPTKMLDVNGNARIRSITTDNTASNIIVADNQGNIGSISKTSLLSSEVDGVIGNEVTKANNGLQITGSGTNSDPLTVGIKDNGITAPMLNQMSATSGQVLKWNGTNWAAGTDNIGLSSISASNGLTANSNNVTLGGTLSSSTGISMNGNNLNFTGSGNIGVGTDSPSTKLDIDGSLKSNSSVTLSGLTSTSNQTYSTIVTDSDGNLYKKENNAKTPSTFVAAAGQKLTANDNNIVLWNYGGDINSKPNFVLPDPKDKLDRIIYLICAAGSTPGTYEGKTVYGCDVNYDLTYRNSTATRVIPSGGRATVMSSSPWGPAWFIIAKDF